MGWPIGYPNLELGAGLVYRVRLKGEGEGSMGSLLPYGTGYKVHIFPWDYLWHILRGIPPTKLDISWAVHGTAYRMHPFPWDR